MSDDVASLEELRAIRSMIAETRRSTGRDWVYLVVWGALGVVASLISQMIVGTTHEQGLWLVWAVYGIAGNIVSSLFARHEERQTRIRTFASRALSTTWTAIGVTVAVIWIVAIYGPLPAVLIPGLVALLIAIGVSVMGVLLEFTPLYAAAVLWWVGGLVMLLRPDEAFALLTGLLVLGYLAPAVLLRSQLAADDAVN